MIMYYSYTKICSQTFLKMKLNKLKKYIFREEFAQEKETLFHRI